MDTGDRLNYLMMTLVQLGLLLTPYVAWKDGDCNLTRMVQYSTYHSNSRLEFAEFIFTDIRHVVHMHQIQCAGATWRMPMKMRYIPCIAINNQTGCHSTILSRVNHKTFNGFFPRQQSIILPSFTKIAEKLFAYVTFTDKQTNRRRCSHCLLITTLVYRQYGWSFSLSDIYYVGHFLARCAAEARRQ